MLGDIRESFGEEPEWADGDEQEEYLDRLGAVEGEEEGDGTVFAEGINPIINPDNTEIWGQRTLRDTGINRTVRNTGARITHLESLNIETPNLMIGDATISETEINHPVIREMQNKIERLEEQMDRLIDINTSMVSELRRRTGEI